MLDIKKRAKRTKERGMGKKPVKVSVTVRVYPDLLSQVDMLRGSVRNRSEFINDALRFSLEHQF